MLKDAIRQDRIELLSGNLKAVCFEDATRKEKSGVVCWGVDAAAAAGAAEPTFYLPLRW